MTTTFEKAPVVKVTEVKSKKLKQDFEFIPASDYAKLGYQAMKGEVGMLAVKSKFTDHIKGIRVRMVAK